MEGRAGTEQEQAEGDGELRYSLNQGLGALELSCPTFRGGN